jgi:hypothetical protein
MWHFLEPTRNTHNTSLFIFCCSNLVCM